MKVNLISESEFTVKGHGVHTAYLEMTRGLEQAGIEVQKNGKKPADVVHIHTIGPYSFWKLLFAKGKKVVSAHVIPASFVGSLKGVKYWGFLAKGWLKFFYKKADLVLACSGSVAKNLREEMKLKNVDILYNAIDVKKYEFTQQEKEDFRKEMRLDMNAKIVVGNGQIQPRKRFDIFIEMAKSLPEIQFIWVGGMPFKSLGAESSKMNKMLENLPKNLKVTGVVPLEEVRKYFVVADVFCLPSMQENHPMAVLEAAATGLPIILRDIVEYNDTFVPFVISAKNDEDFTSEVKKLFADEKYFSHYKEASKNIKNRFSTENNTKILLNFYKTLLN